MRVNILYSFYESSYVLIWYIRWELDFIMIFLTKLYILVYLNIIDLQGKKDISKKC